MKTLSPSARYEFRINEEAVPIEDLIGQPNRLLDYYLQLDDLSCCSVLGGFIIYADDQVAMGETDEVSMSQTWLPAIIRLQQGENRVFVWVWEESNMTLTRQNNLMQMEDVHSSGDVVCAKVQFPFDEFVRAMLHASRPMAQFVDEFHAAIALYQKNPTFTKHSEAMDRLRFLNEEFSSDWKDLIMESESLLAD
tara:strand:- start:132 stop:713 length:582 start_codon:yes stop_codon:yes gene_type:complete